MHSEQAGYASAHNNKEHDTLEMRRPEAEYNEAEESFVEMMQADCLDEYVKGRPSIVRSFERALEEALASAYTVIADGVEINNRASIPESARLFLQRVLYRINRLKFFWYDDLSNYDNERSSYLRQIRDRIEGAWASWELALLDVASFPYEDVREGLLRRSAYDVSPTPSASGLYFRNEIREAGYRRLLAIASLDGLVEASQLSRTLGGVSNDIHAVMTRLLVEEYGGGRLNRKHSTFFTAMLTELNMRTEPEAYFEIVPWEVLTAINHSFLLSERKRFYLRYV
ncbi:MAG: iron-containing redox enzyme family protein, partial [Acidobacteria bacterium]|nr:iron-containing redox enzyme family protein [Acidobacteriota bacterium]